MTLPAITLPKVELPFDILVLLHPFVDHFMIALPVIVLLIELINIGMKKRALSGLSLFLLLLTVVAAVAAYLTGLVDGKEAFPALSEAAKSELAGHKLLGTYVLLASGVVFIFKLLSMMISKGLIKGLYILLLIAFVAAIFKQGQEGGELVYEYGMNVEQVKVLDDELFDLKEELEEATAKMEVPTEVEKTEAVDLPTPIQSVKTPVETLPEAVKVDVQEVIVPAVQEKVEALQVEGMPEEMVQPEIATH